MITALSALAQQADSVYFYTQTRTGLSFALSSATQLIATDTGLFRVGILEARYQQQEGGLRRSQVAQQSRQAVLYTEGIATLGRFRVAGLFQFDRGWDDSLAYNMSPQNDPVAPYYYFAGKAGKYERQNYRFKAIGTYALQPGKLWLGASMDYNYNWMSGSLDPRPENKTLTVYLQPELTWRKGPHTIGVSGEYGFGQENNSIQYMNDNYIGGTIYPERIYYLNRGYGTIAMRDQAIYQRVRSYYGGGAQYHLGLNEWEVRAGLRFRWLTEKNTREQFARNKLAVHSMWYMQDWSGEAMVQRNAGKSRQQLHLRGGVQLGDNMDSLYNAANYLYDRYHGGFTYLRMPKEHRRFTPEWGIKLDAESVKRQDFLQSHLAEYAYLQPGAVLNLYWSQKNGDRFSLNIEPSLRLPINNNLQVPTTQVNVFTVGIAYPDYYYWKSTLLNAHTGARWVSKRIIPKMTSGFSLDVDYSARLNNHEIIYPAAFLPDVSRIGIKAGFQLYL